MRKRAVSTRKACALLRPRLPLQRQNIRGMQACKNRLGAPVCEILRRSGRLACLTVSFLTAGRSIENGAAIIALSGAGVKGRDAAAAGTRRTYPPRLVLSGIARPFVARCVRPQNGRLLQSRCSRLPENLRQLLGRTLAWLYIIFLGRFAQFV